MIQQALILAGGLGTRLGSLTKTAPKPMLPVAGRPFLEYLVLNLRRFDVKRIVLSVGYLHDIIESHFQDGRNLGVTIEYSVEMEPLGTGGGIRSASNMLDDSFLVLNGDTFLDCNYLDLGLMLKPGISAAIALRSIVDVSRYGNVTMAGERVLQFVEKGNSGPGLVNAGVYILTQAALDYLPVGYSSIESNLFPLLAAQGRLAARICSGFFIDIGLPETLSEANRIIPNWIAGLEL